MKQDYFDADLEPEDAVPPLMGPAKEVDKEAISPPLKDEETPRKRQIMGYDLSTLLIAGCVIIALSVYAAWPDSPPPQAFIPDNTVQQEPLEHAAPPDPTPSPEVMDTGLPSSGDTTATLVPGITEKVTDEIRQDGIANREAIMALTGRLSDTERRVALLEEQLRAQQQRTVPVSKVTAPPTAKTSANTPRVKNAPQSTSVAHSANSVKGWRVHTLYPGMAWITHNGSTWSVRPGDVLQGMTIRSIDTERRVVVTDKGTIRQEN